jgi:2-desacetyl-2-hydroxyethyl bacteriochlorophyllide A dehydrogenase
MKITNLACLRRPVRFDAIMKTKAIVIPAANTVEIREVELKPLGAEDVLVQTTITSISAGTERMLMRGVMPHPMLQFPVVPGYETVGEVIDAGAESIHRCAEDASHRSAIAE